MNWVGVAAAAVLLLGAGSASAATFTVDVNAPPTIDYRSDGEIQYLSGSASFPDVTLTVGDQLVVNVDYGEALSNADLLEYDDTVVNFNAARGSSLDSGTVQLSYPYNFSIGIGSTGFSITAYVVDNFGTPTEGTYNFDLNAISYSVTAVPEPQVWAMLLAGIAGIGVVLRRRRASVCATHTALVRS